MKKIKLFCFPYAGGSAIIYSKWKQYFDPSIELRPIELAGRGKRINEPLYNDIGDAVEDVFNIVKNEINGHPYSIFGHSMGGMISYLLSQKLRENKFPDAMHIFFSGWSAPHVIRPDEKKYHLLEGEEFKKEVINLGGTPREFFEHPELLKIFLPLLKNDFKLSETDIKGEINPFDCNITVFLGKDDDFNSEQCDGWKKHTKKLCNIHYFEGGHFFLHDNTEKIVKLINHALLGKIYV